MFKRKDPTVSRLELELRALASSDKLVNLRPEVDVLLRDGPEEAVDDLGEGDGDVMSSAKGGGDVLEELGDRVVEHLVAGAGADAGKERHEHCINE